MDKIIKKINKKQKKMMCYEASHCVIKMIGKKKKIYKKVIVNDMEQFKQIMGKYKVYNVEILIETKDNYDKHNLLKKYKIDRTVPFNNFVFKKPHLRLFIHAFNVVMTKNHYYVMQSWFQKQDYHIVYKLKHNNNFVDKLINKLDNFVDQPDALFKLFIPKVDKNDPLFSDHKEVTRMIKKEKFPINVIITVEHTK